MVAISILIGVGCMFSRFLLWLLAVTGNAPRGLFVFFDGTRYRKIDPITVARTLMTFPQFDWDETPKMLQIPQVTHQLEALALISSAVRSAFGLKPASDGGLTELECRNLLFEFRAYLGDVKKNGPLIPILPDSTELPQSAPVESSLPKPASDSGSTATVPSPVPHGSLQGPTSA